ncbi:hypothetical protein SUGI_0717330 [Cryptomeria japonica]|nr:hypothetical protein SUGI_0717330 [Cryptomeria japonica]
MDYFSSSGPLVSLIVRLFLIFCLLATESSALTSANSSGGITWTNNNCSSGFLPSSAYADAFVRPILKRRCAVRHSNGVSNREQMVQENATLTLTSTGELVLKDADGTLVWSTNTSTHDFQGMAIQVSGNLVLLNNSNGIMWQSFDYPTDTLLFGQKLKVGQNLIANISPTNTSQGNFGCSLSVDSFLMYTAKVPPQIYYRYPKSPPPVKLSYLQFDNEPFHVFPFINFSTPKGCLYSKIIPDGHLQFYSILEASGRSVIDYLSTFTRSLGMCDYPMACGNYGVCRDGQCSCPKEGNDFVQIDATEPNSGCLLNRPLVCSDASKSINPADSRQFLELEHTSYFTYSHNNTSISQFVSPDYCQNLCRANCSCCVFQFSQGISRVSIWFLVIISAAIGGVFLLFLLLYIWISKYRGGRHEKDEDEDDPEDWLSGLPLRYTFQELKHATNDFSMKLGKGGFGSVYEESFSGKRSRELSENGLFSVLQVKAEAGRLIDLVYEGFEDDETSVIEEAVKLLKVGMWCVEVDFWRRPAMSTVVKALEGLVDTLDDVPSTTTGFPVASNYNSEFSYTPFSVLSRPR